MVSRKIKIASHRGNQPGRCQVDDMEMETNMWAVNEMERDILHVRWLPSHIINQVDDIYSRQSASHHCHVLITLHLPTSLVLQLSPTPTPPLMGTFAKGSLIQYHGNPSLPWRFSTYVSWYCKHILHRERVLAVSLFFLSFHHRNTQY